MRDVLWFGPEILLPFVQECWEVLPDSPLDRRQKLSLPIGVTRVAFHESVLLDEQDLNWIYDPAYCFSGKSIMYIIAGEIPGFHVYGDPAKVHPRWELDHTQNANALAWNRHIDGFDFRGGPQILVEFAYHRILEASDMIIARTGPPHKIREADFEIQPVLAIRV
jgi:hypothetical protein